MELLRVGARLELCHKRSIPGRVKWDRGRFGGWKLEQTRVVTIFNFYSRGTRLRQTGQSSISQPLPGIVRFRKSVPSIKFSSCSGVSVVICRHKNPQSVGKDFGLVLTILQPHWFSWSLWSWARHVVVAWMNDGYVKLAMRTGISLLWPLQLFATCEFSRVPRHPDILICKMRWKGLSEHLWDLYMLTI